MNIDMTMFHQAFFDESIDLMNDMETRLLTLEENSSDPEVLNTIFRCAHSIKGGSATFGFGAVADFTHGLETLLDRVRNGEIPVEPTLTQILFEALDQIRALVDVARAVRGEAPDATALTERIEAAIHGGRTTQPPPEAVVDVVAEDGSWGLWSQSRTLSIDFKPAADIIRQGLDPLLMIKELTNAGDVLNLICDSSAVPPLEEMDPETCYLSWHVELRTDLDDAALRAIFEFAPEGSTLVITVSAAKAHAPDAVAEDENVGPAKPVAEKATIEPEVQSAPAGKADAPAVSPAAADRKASMETSDHLKTVAADTQTLRVSTDKVDKLINLVGELVINQSMLNDVVTNFSMESLPRLLEAVAQMERASRELQERVMAVRMLPIKHAFGRFPRLVRDMASKCGKHIELKMSGEETELDKTVIEAISDPLTHLVRNSMDHGFETPAERAATGKPDTCVILLHAFQEGGNIVIEVSDDGRGLNRDKILRKAVERGMVAGDDSALTDDAVFNFIFQPGFSTADQVTEISGRGVGMDIVKRSVQSLGGSISVWSAAGEGTRFRIRLPLTMAILEGLSLSVGGEIYILPLTSIVESIRPKAGEVRTVTGDTEVALVRGEVLPILRLYQVFGANAAITDPTRGLLVIVENDNHKVALLVDELIGQSQVVIKSLETNYQKVRGIAGATILGDGRVALIVDVPGLLHGMEACSARLAA